MAFSSLFIMLFSYAGIAAGYFLGKIAPEERKPLRKAVLTLQHLSIITALIAGWFGAYVRKNTALMLSLLAIVLMVIYLHTLAKGALKQYRISLTSIALAVFIMFSSGSMVIVTASCAFAFFTCLGIVQTTSKLSSLMELASETFWFLVVALITLL